MLKKSFLDKCDSKNLPQKVVMEWCKLDPDNYEARWHAVLSACDAGKIKFTHEDSFVPSVYYCTDYETFVEYLADYGQLAIEKTSFDEWIAEVEGKGDAGGISCCDLKHPFFARELKIASESWRELYEINPPDGVPKGGHKKYIEDHLKMKYPDLGSNALNRIATVINPNPKGGASPSE